LLHAWQGRDKRAWPDRLCGSLCLAAAPFFHVSAWIAVLPLAALLAGVSLRGHPALLCAPLAVLAGLAGFLLQSRFVTDSYELTRLLGFVFAHPLAWSAAGVLGAAAAVALSLRVRGRRTAAPAGRDTRLSAAGAVVAAVTVAGLLLSFFNVFSGTIQESGERALRIVGVTDARAVVQGVSLPVAVAGLAGWCVLLLRGGDGRRTRLVFGLALLPSLLLVGRIPILMYFLRRAFPFLVPALAVALAALVSLIPSGNGRWKQVTLAGSLGLLALLGIPGRTHLFALTDLRGFKAYLDRFAEPVKRENGILLCEYSRIAAPFDHFYGIPTLGLDNERRYEYGPALEAWEAIMRRDPEQAAFFLTPFGPPFSDRFDFEPLVAAGFSMRMLRSAAGRLPRVIREPVLNLSLYRMRLRNNLDPPHQPGVPCVRRIDESNMGLRGFHAGRTRTWEQGVEMYARWARAEAQVLLPAPPGGKGVLLLLVNPCHPDEHKRLRLQVSSPGSVMPASSHKLDPEGWQWIVCPFPCAGNNLQWVRLTTRPALNPGRYGYPRDLGVLLKYVVVLPSLEAFL